MPLYSKYSKEQSDQISCSVASNSFDPMNRSTPGLPVHHQLPEFTETHVHRVSDAIQPSHPPIPPSIRVFSNESTLPRRWPKYWSFSFSIILKICLSCFTCLRRYLERKRTCLVVQWMRICLQCRRPQFDSWVGKIHWRRDRLPLAFSVYLYYTLIGKDPNAGRDWGQEEKGMTGDEMAGWHH